MWKDIPGWEGLYQISENGIIKSIFRKVKSSRWIPVRRVDEKILKPRYDKNGYLRVGLNSEGRQKMHPVHRLVGLTFIPNPENKPQINHINGVKDDNRVENLEWCTASENSIHAFKLGLKVPSCPGRGKLGKDNVNSKQVTQYTIDMKVVAIYGSAMEAARVTGFGRSQICRVCRGVLRKTHGFVFKYT